MKHRILYISFVMVCLILHSACRREGPVAKDVKISTGYSENMDPLAAAQEATKMALEQLGTTDVKGVVFYENYRGHEQEKEIGRAVMESAPNVPSIGVRAIPYCDKGAMWEHSVVVMAIGGRDANVKVASAPLIDDRMSMGKNLGAELETVQDLKLVLVLSEPNLSFAPDHVSVEAFLQGMKETLGPEVMVFGGNGMPRAGGSAEYINGNYNEGTAVAMAIGGPVRFIGTNTNEFEASEEVVAVTKARGKWVMEFDGQPAAEVYRKLSGKKPGEPITYDDVDPIGVDLGDGQVYLRMVLFEKKAKYTPQEARRKNYIEESKDLPVGSLRFVAEVPEGTKARILKYHASAERILDSATAAVSRSLELLQEGEKPLVVLTSSCCARRGRLRKLDPNADEVLHGIKPAMKAEVFPVFGLDAFGELGPINNPCKGLPYQYQQHTFVSGVLALSR